MAEKNSRKRPRRAYIDWMRGLAVVLMFQTHAYHSWLTPAAKQSAFFHWSQVVGGMPASLFLFLAGIGFSLMMDAMARKGAAPDEVFRRAARRGGFIVLMGTIMKFQAFVMSYPYQPWTNLLNAEVLTAIGLSMILMSPLAFAQSRVRRSFLFAAAIALAIAFLTPLVWIAPFPAWFPLPAQGFFRGSAFPLFPWTGYAFAGFAAGSCLVWVTANKRAEGQMLLRMAIAGAALFAIGKIFDSIPFQLYPVSDFWRTSPNFFAEKLGVMLLMLGPIHLWCESRWGRRWSPMLELGTTSLMLYWVHLEFVYGHSAEGLKESLGIGRASLALAMLTVGMWGLASLRLETKAQVKTFAAGIRAFLSPRSAERKTETILPV